MAEPTIYFEDLAPGDETVLGSVTVSAEEIVAFAEQWDFQPMHLSEGAATDTFLGRLTASGWHTCCILMRLMCDSFLLQADSRGAPGIEEVRWIKPVLPGDSLTATRIVLDKRLSRSRPDRGVIRCRYELTNQRGDTVMTATFPAFYGCRQVAEAAT
jgi:acyl dehydratase